MGGSRSRSRQESAEAEAEAEQELETVRSERWKGATDEQEQKMDRSAYFFELLPNHKVMLR